MSRRAAFEGYWETGIQSWDIAAGVVLVREAGGFVTEIGGGSDFLKSGCIVAANPDLHDRTAPGFPCRQGLRRATCSQAVPTGTPR